jgi:hypothetical protein
MEQLVRSPDYISNSMPLNVEPKIGSDKTRHAGGRCNEAPFQPAFPFALILVPRDPRLYGMLEASRRRTQ